MTIKQAQAAAVARGLAIDSTEQEQPPTEVTVLSFKEYNDTYQNGSASQLAPESSVILVHVRRPFPTEALPRPEGSEPGNDWPSYFVSFDPRTALVIGVFPGE